MDKKYDPSHRFFTSYTAWLDNYVTPLAEKAVKRLRREPVEADELPPGIFLSELSNDELKAIHLHSWFAVRALCVIKDMAMTEIEDRENGREEEDEAEDEE